MKCDNKICVYQENGQCRNGEVEIDWRGICKNMTPIRITADNLNASKLYSNTVLECGDYRFEREKGEYIWYKD